MGKEFYIDFIMAALLFTCVLLIASSCGPSDADADCRELIVVCGDKTISNDECVQDAKVVLTIPPEVRFTRCDGTKGSITLEGGDCRVSKGKACS